MHTAVPATFGACPSPTGGEATLIKQDGGEAAVADVGVPRDGKVALCVRGTVETAQGRLDILQQAGRREGTVIVPTDDSGTVLAFDPAVPGKNYKLSIHSVGQTDLYGVYDRLPTARQIAAILDGKDPQTAHATSTAAYAANGDITMVRAGEDR